MTFNIQKTSLGRTTHYKLFCTYFKRVLFVFQKQLLLCGRRKHKEIVLTISYNSFFLRSNTILPKTVNLAKRKNIVQYQRLIKKKTRLLK